MKQSTEEVSVRPKTRIDRAVDYVSDRWFPINKALLEKIQYNIDKDHYEEHFDELLNQLCSDASLFAYSIRKVSELLKLEGKVLPNSLTPREIFEWAGKNCLYEALDVAPTAMSHYSMYEASDLQMRRFQEMLTSVSVAEQLSEAYSIEPELAYSTAILRQVGYALIAWNYPGLYEETVALLQRGESLDILLSKRLGFSPTLLTMKVFEQSGIPIESTLRMGLVDDEIDLFIGGDTPPGGIGELVEICRVGEALARAYQGDLYPKAKEDWNYAHQEIVTKLGEDGFARVHEHIVEAASGYSDVMPDIVHFAIPEEAFAYIAAHQEEPLERQNPYISISSPAVARKLRALYGETGKESLTPQNVRSIIDVVIPEAGFSGGCIYTPDPTLMMLIPQIDFGTLQLRNLSAVDYSVVLSDADIVALAFQSDEPIVHYKMGRSGEVVTAIVGVVGHSRKVGVLYLEIPEAVSDFIGDQKVIHYKAVRHALSDALYLR